MRLQSYDAPASVCLPSFLSVYLSLPKRVNESKRYSAAVQKFHF
jgi:hypothetical protein